MDYWDYLAHSKGDERAGHRYYARELIGNKGGRNQYRYFYTAEEYAAYRKGIGTNPGRNTYAENGTSRNAAILNRTNPNRESDNARRGELHRNRVNEAIADKVHKDALAFRAERRGEKHNNRITQARAEQVQKDAYAYNRNRAREKLMAQKAENARNARGEKHRNRVTEAIAGRVKQEAEAYRNKRATEARAAQVKKDARAFRNKRRAAQKAEMDRQRRGRKHAQRVIQARAEKVHKDAVAYREKKREMLRQKRAGQKRIMDNIRQRPYYQPTIKR